MKKILITRDSVALSDDINAPHFLDIVIVSNSSILEIIKHIIKLNYFPLVEGGKATWNIIFNKKILNTQFLHITQFLKMK